MRRAFVAIVATLLIASPLELSAKHIAKHHAAKAQTAGCAVGATPPAAGCGISDMAVGGALNATDAIAICQQGTGGCPASATTWKLTQVPLLPRIQAVWPHLTDTGTQTQINYNAASGSAFPVFATPPVVRITNLDGNSAEFGSLGFNAAGHMVIGRADGTGAAPTRVISGDLLGTISWGGWDGVNAIASSATISGFAADTFADSTHHGARLLISTTPAASGTPAYIMGWEPDGGVTMPPAPATGGLASKGPGTINVSGGFYVNGTAISGGTGGGGTVNAGSAGQLAYYSSAGSAVSGLAAGTSGQVLTAAASGPPTWQPPSGGGTPAAYAGVFAGGPVTYTMASPTPAGWANTPGFHLCGAFATANGASPTLAVAGLAALPIHNQTPSGETTLVGGEIIGATRCVSVNANASAYILDALVGGGVTILTGAPHTVTTSEWAYGQLFTCTANCTLTLPPSTTVPNQGSISTTSTNAVVTLAPAATDTINTGAAGATVALPVNAAGTVTTDGAGHFYVNNAVTSFITTSWIPNANLNASNVSFYINTGSHVINSIQCVVDTLVGGAATINIYRVPTGTASGTPAAPGGTLLSDTANCNANASAGTNQAFNTATSANWTLSAGDRLVLVSTGAGWASSAGAGSITMILR